MKIRPLALTTAALITAALDLVVLSPAHADAVDPVTGISVTQSQGADHSWVVDASWDANPDATGYQVAITDRADGTNLDGDFHSSRHVAGTSAELTTDNLLDGDTYYVTVRTIGATEGTPASTAFAAATLDRTGPVGTFTVSKRKAWLIANFDLEGFSEKATVSLTQTSLSDDTTPADHITRSVQSGDGSAARRWSGSTFSLTYAKAGTFTPQVLLTDAFGNTSTVALPTVTVQRDQVAPTVHLARPAASQRDTVNAWRSLHGTAYDGQSGIDAVLVRVAEKRDARWYVYDFDTRRWVRGSTSLQKSLENVDAAPAILGVRADRSWHAPMIRSLVKGSLHVETYAVDRAENFGPGPTVNRALTR